ncbi:MAG: hypothetical protein ABH812_03595 [bacterium]
MSVEIKSLYDNFKFETDHFKKAEILHILSKEKGIGFSEIGKNINLSPSYISHILRLLKLPDLIVDGYYSKLIAVTHLYIISRLSTHKEMIEVYETVLTKNLTTLETDEIVRQKLFGIKSEGQYMTNEEKQHLGDKITQIVDGKSKIVQSRINSKLTITIKGSLKETTEKLRKLFKVFSN